MTRPLILLSNDDGREATGLLQLRDALSVHVDVVICAPFAEQSASSHAITLKSPMRLRSHEQGVFSVDGTPADSVYVALCAGQRILPRKPDLVVSGINHGVNLGSDVFYSGTVAAAREAALRGFRALALSANVDTDWQAAIRSSVSLVLGLLVAPTVEVGSGAQKSGLLLNANFPAGSPAEGEQWSVQATHLGIRKYEDAVGFRSDPRGAEYFWMGGAGVSHQGQTGSDTVAHDAGVVGITPLSLEMWASQQQPWVEKLAASVNRC